MLTTQSAFRMTWMLPNHTELRARRVGIGLFVLVGQLTVFGGTAAAQPDACRVGQELDPGDYCTVDIPGVNVGTNRFEVTPDGRGCYGGICAGRSLNLSGFEASRITGTSRWRIDALPGGGTNQAPRATGSVPAQTLTVGGSSASVNVARYFTDPDGDRLTYTARSSRTGVVRASVSNSMVTLSPVSAGTATVTVTARDPDSASARQSIAVTVEDQRGPKALWSSTLTAAPFETTSGTRFMGYMRTEGEDGVRQRGELSDRDFDFRGTARQVPFLAQNREFGSIVLRIGPRLDEQDVESMTLTLDDHALAASDATLFPQSNFGGRPVLSIVWSDPGFRWSEGQRIAVQLDDGTGPGGGNRAPRATGSVPAQTLTVGGRSASVNVAQYFTDPDGDALTYTARSSRTGIVTAAAAGSTVTLAPVAAGTATVTVTARDPGGASATQSIAVTVQAAVVANGFTDDPLVPGVTPVRAVHFMELRTRIDALRTGAGLSAYAWTDRALTPGVTRVRTVHLTELRTALNEAYSAAGQPPPAYTDASVSAGATPIRAAHVTELRAAVVELEPVLPGSPDAGLAPVDRAAFDERVVGKQITQGSSRLVFTAPGRIREFEDGTPYDGDYEYRRISANAGTLVYTYDVTGNDPNRERSEVQFTFRTETSGTFEYSYFEHGARRETSRGSFQLVNAPAVQANRAPRVQRLPDEQDLGNRQLADRRAALNGSPAVR